MYWKLAIQNIRRSLRDYIIYFVTLTLIALCDVLLFRDELFYYESFGLFAVLILVQLAATGVAAFHIYQEKRKTSVYKGYKQDKIEMRGDRAEMSDFPLYLNTVAGGLDRRDQTIGGFSFVVKIYAVPVIEIIG